MVILLASILITAATAEEIHNLDRLGVVSLNLYHEKNRKKLVNMADEFQNGFKSMPQFFIFQEVMFDKKKKGETASVRHFAEKTGYHFRGINRPSDKEGLAIASKYPFTHFETLKFQKQSLTLPWYKRIAIMGEFDVPGVGLVRVVNTHLTNWPWEDNDRKKQLTETFEWINKRQNEVPADVILFGGDLNGESSDQKISEVLTDPSLMDGRLFENFNSEEATKNVLGAHRRIDQLFIWTNQQLNVAGRYEHIFDTDFSDHMGLAHFYDLDHTVALTELPTSPLPLICLPRPFQFFSDLHAITNGTSLRQ